MVTRLRENFTDASTTRQVGYAYSASDWILIRKNGPVVPVLYVYQILFYRVAYYYAKCASIIVVLLLCIIKNQIVQRLALDPTVGV